jgi:hypothetical protein
MKRYRQFGLLGFVLAVGVAPLGGAQDAAKALTGNRRILETAIGHQDQQVDREIKALIKDLADSSEATRDRAANRLVEIGLPALEALMEAQAQSELATRQRIFAVIVRIRLPQGPPIVVNGMEFKLKVETEWLMPQLAKSKLIPIILEITNKSDRVYRLRLAGTKVFLKDAKGQDVLERWQKTSDSTHPTSSPPLAKNDTYALPFKGQLGTSKQGAFSFACWDVFAWMWANTARLTSGSYSFGLVYENKVEESGSKEPYWVGRAMTSPTTVVIKREK